MSVVGASPCADLRFAAPAPGALIDWPDDFGRRFMVSVDTEEEFDWSRPPEASARAVTAIRALPAAHARFTAAGVPILYLADYPVVRDPNAATILRDMVAAGGAEVGAQLHPWVNPPYEEAQGRVTSFAGNLPPAVEAAKLDRLVAAITTVMGRAPRAFRAGRYGLGPETLALLRRRGFRADLSMRARFDYREAGGPDFTAIGPSAFRPIDGLVELPLTTVFTGRWRAGGERFHAAAGRWPRGRGVLARLGLLSRVPLTPEGTPAREAVRAIATAAADGERLLQLSFHSPSLVPGHTPYVRTPQDKAAFDRWWGVVLDALARHGYVPASLEQVLAAAGWSACQRNGD